MKTTFFILIAVLLVGCFASDKKLYIKSVRLSKANRVDWYFHSLIGGYTRSYLQYVDENNVQKTFFESFYLSDFGNNGDTLTIQVYMNDYKLDKAKADALGLVIKIDTTGRICNQASSRLGRLQSKHVDFKKYHFEDSYGPKYECY